MKHNYALLLLLLFFPTLACSSERDYVQESSRLYAQESFAEALKVIDAGIEDFGPTDSMISTRYKILFALEKYEDTLETFEIILQRNGEAPDIAIDKIRLLDLLGRYEEALEYAVMIDEASPEKSLYISSYICKLHVRMGQKESALDWLNVSLDRGDYSYEYYLQDTFQLLHGEPGFPEVIQIMKGKAGIGHQVDDFVASIVSGGTYTLSEDRGKVVLIDFWATWCPPCVAEFPHLREIYGELNQEGFEIIGISLDSDRQELIRFLETRKIPWKIGFSGKGMDDDVARTFRVDSAPRYLLVDRDGFVQYSSALGGDKLEGAIRELVVR